MANNLMPPNLHTGKTASLGGSDAGSQLVGNSRHSTMLSGSQDADIGAYRAATSHYGGQYASVYGSSVLTAAQQAQSLGSKGVGATSHENRGDYTRGDYLPSNLGYSHKDDQFADKVVDYASTERSHFGREFQPESTMRYVNSAGFANQHKFDENLGHGTYLQELVHCYRADWVKDDNKYGQYESINPSSFQNQIYEGPDTDIETEIQLAQRRHARLDNLGEDEPGSTSSRKHKDVSFNTLLKTKNLGESPLPAYEPAFDWENERSMIFGQRLPEIHPLFYDRGLKICVKVLSLSFQAGLVEPFHGTMCLFDKEKRERLSEDFFFHILPHESQDVWSSYQHQAIFHLDVPSSSVCLLVKLERSATEESGVTSSVYSRKEPANLTEREKQKLQLWSQIMPYREAFAWSMVPLFDNLNNAAFGGYGSPGSSLTSPMSVSSPHDGVTWNSSKTALNGNSCWTHSNSTIIGVSNFNKVKESYTEDHLNDPKRKVHKPVKGTLKFEIEKIQSDNTDMENYSENGSVINDSNDPTDELVECTHVKFSNNDQVDSPNTNSWRNIQGRKQTVGNGIKEPGNIGNENVHILDYHTIMRNEPFMQLLHFLYVYPLTVSLGHKKNLFIRVELRSDDKDVPKEPLKAVYAREPGAVIQKWVHTQVSIGTRLACFHDEIKLCLPIIWTPSHHILFTFFHIDLQMKNDPPKPVVVGYATLPLATISQHLSEISLPIMRDLLPHYLQDVNKDRVEYFEEGKLLYRLRLRLCSSLFPFNERIRDFFCEYDQHSFHSGPPWGSELLEAINSLKNVESLTLIQFLHPLLNMLLHLISSSGETLQVAAFRAMVNILTRVQQESVDDTERNAFLGSYVDYIFDDFEGRLLPVYHGVSTVWGSLARSKAKGYRVGPVYDDVLAMAWFFLELIAKSMALEKIYIFQQSMLASEDIPPLQLKEGVFRCIMQLYDCLLSEVHERLKKGLILAKRLNSSLAYFCYDLLSVVEPRQIFELISLYLDRFTGLCIPALHDCKLTFLQIVCDHDLFVEMPGRDPSERNYLSSILIQELFLTCDHDDLPQRSKATRIIVIILCKHEFDIRYQKHEDKLYISQLYFPFLGQILDEIHIFYNLNVVEKREVLIAVLQILRNIDEVSLINLWKLSIARTRLFFKLLEECLNLFEHKKPIDSMLIGNSSRTLGSVRPTSPRYTDRLSPAINIYLSEAARQELIPHGTSENSSLWQRVITSPNQPYSLREALAQAQSSRIGASMHALRESLHPVLRQKLELWEENLSASVSLQVLEITEKFSRFAASSNMIATDVGKLDCITVILMSLMSRSQPLDFWKAFLPIFNEIFNLHGTTLMSRENDRFLKQMAFHLLRLAVFRNENIRERAVIGLQILVRSSSHFRQMARLRAMLIITLSELMSDMHVTQMRPDGTLEESSESCRLRRSLEEVADEMGSRRRLKSCGLPEDALVEVPENDRQRMWSWKEVKFLSNSLLMALAATLEHTIMVSMVNTDRYAVAESFYKLAIAFSPVPDLHIMWLLHLCDAHQEMQCWAEAAQCAVSVAGVVMQALVSRNEGIWSKEHLSALRNICPAVNIETTSETSAAEVEGYGASKLTVDSAVKYLQLANKLFSHAELYHFCATIIELIIPVYKSRRSYGQLANCHTLLTNIYESILEQHASPIPFADATYYRVGFYGSKFGKLDRKEYLYREPPDVRLGDIMKKLTHIYEPKPGLNSQPLQIIPDSRQVNPEELDTGVCHLQITAVDPVMEDEDMGTRRDSRVQVVFDRFIFDTPFTKNGKTQGGLEDQWKRRSVVKTEGSFPALVNRLVIVKSESMEFSPVENAIGMIEARTSALRNELEEPRHSDGDHHLPRLQGLQRILQGSVAVQVNSGVLGVCSAFLSGEPATRLRSQELQQLIAALLEFMAVCKRAIKVHLRLIGEGDEEFHTQLVNGFQSLTAELSHYIPAILSEL